jgi:hypothetical protein
MQSAPPLCLVGDTATDTAPDKRPGKFTDNFPDKRGSVEHAVRSYLKAYQRLFKARPSLLQYRILQAAALSAARYDRALRDLTISGATLAHYERVHRKAQEALNAILPRPAP